MIDNTKTKNSLLAKIEWLSQQIDEQARWLLSHPTPAQSEKIQEQFHLLGIPLTNEVRFKAMWEDLENHLLPPHIIATTMVSKAGEAEKITFPVAVGEFHDPQKNERLFEMCMLRAECHQELVGSGDGHVIERIKGLQQEVATLLDNRR